MKQSRLNEAKRVSFGVFKESLQREAPSKMISVVGGRMIDKIQKFVDENTVLTKDGETVKPVDTLDSGLLAFEAIDSVVSEVIKLTPKEEELSKLFKNIYSSPNAEKTYRLPPHLLKSSADPAMVKEEKEKLLAKFYAAALQEMAKASLEKDGSFSRVWRLSAGEFMLTLDILSTNDLEDREFYRFDDVKLMCSGIVSPPDGEKRTLISEYGSRNSLFVIRVIEKLFSKLQSVENKVLTLFSDEDLREFVSSSVNLRKVLNKNLSDLAPSKAYRSRTTSAEARVDATFTSLLSDVDVNPILAVAVADSRSLVSPTLLKAKLNIIRQDSPESREALEVAMEQVRSDACKKLELFYVANRSKAVENPQELISLLAVEASKYVSL